MNNELPRVEAVAAVKGKIVQLGTSEDLLKKSSKELKINELCNRC